MSQRSLQRFAHLARAPPCFVCRPFPYNASKFIVTRTPPLQSCVVMDNPTSRPSSPMTSPRQGVSSMANEPPVSPNHDNADVAPTPTADKPPPPPAPIDAEPSQAPQGPPSPSPAVASPEASRSLEPPTPPSDQLDPEATISEPAAPSEPQTTAAQFDATPVSNDEPQPAAPAKDGAETAAAVDIEEGRDQYRPGGFHPVYIGDVYNGKYEVLNKIGYGAYSTVWLVKNLKPGPDDKAPYLALKVLSGECYGGEKDTFELEILRHLRDGDREQLGYAYVCHLVDDFEHEGPNGKHVCLVFELMGETLGEFGVWYKECQLPYSVMRRFTIQLILALDFAHEHNVIHTDLKPNNIFVKFRDYSRIESGYLIKEPIPEQDRREARYTVIPSHPLINYYFSRETDWDNFDQFDIALGDWGVSSWIDNHLTEKIQPVALRAPEVLIGAPWNEKADWWSLGAVVLEVYRAVRMFDGRGPPDGQYSLKQHLREIVDLFGPFPKELLEKGNKEIVAEMFDDEGWIKDAPPLERKGLASDLFMPNMVQEWRDDFADWLRGVMKINPDERMSAVEMLQHTWVDAMKK